MRCRAWPNAVFQVMWRLADILVDWSSLFSRKSSLWDVYKYFNASRILSSQSKDCINRCMPTFVREMLCSDLSVRALPFINADTQIADDTAYNLKSFLAAHFFISNCFHSKELRSACMAEIVKTSAFSALCLVLHNVEQPMVTMSRKCASAKSSGQSVGANCKASITRVPLCIFFNSWAGLWTL